MSGSDNRSNRNVCCSKDTTFVAKGNPIVNYKYLGDPAALVHNGTVYIYAGHDECPAPEQYYLMNEWCILSTKDMKTFTEHAYTFKAKEFKWAKEKHGQVR